MIKPAIYLAIITAVIGGFTAGYNAIEQSGYDRAMVEVSEQHKKQLVGITDRFKDDLEAAKHEAEHFRKIAVLMQSQEPIIITKWKERVIHENPDCTNLHGFSVMLNESIQRFNY